MIFGNNHVLNNFSDMKLNYDNAAIERIDKFKYLSVILDPLLSWCDHIDYVSSTISKRIGARFYLPSNTLNMLSNALVLIILIIAVLFGQTAKLSFLIHSKFCKASLLIYFYLSISGLPLMI